MSRLFGNKAINIQRKYYSMVTNPDEDSADITMYGEIVEEQPYDWWTGEPIEGNYITRKEFISDLDSLGKRKTLTIHMDSVGGDAAVSFFIHNKLRELSDNGTKTVCIVDGVAMSGGSIIMSACDTVKVNASSLIMIHKCWSFLMGGYNSDDLRQMATSNDAYDKAQANAYIRKTGLSEREILKMMANTTYMTGRDAVEKGFADELLEGDAYKIAASANGTSLFVNGRQMHLAPGMFAPDFIPTISPEELSAEIKENQTEVTVEEKGGNPMTKEELRENYPDLVAELEADARAVGASDEVINGAISAERIRMQEIDSIACLYDDELVNEAKYGEHACSAQELAYRAAQKAAKQGASILANLESDTANSGTNNVEPSPTPIDDGVEDEKESTPEAKLAKARASVASIFGKTNKEE